MPCAWSALAPRECRCATEINVDLPQHWPRSHCFSAHCVPLVRKQESLLVMVSPLFPPLIKGGQGGSTRCGG
jgi:hypothetical protein